MTVIDHGTDAHTTTTITVPGIYDGIPEADYHNDPVPAGSLSHSGAKLLLDCPARYQYRLANPEHRDVFEFGRAAHTHVLGIGGPVTIIDADNWRTKAAQEARDEARNNGHTPILSGDWETVQQMAAAITAHPIAAALLADGTSEQSMFWQTPAGHWLRARADRLPTPGARARTILTDYKTAPNADNASFAKAVANYGYHTQAAWYLDGWATLTGEQDAAFVFIVQEKTAPYLVNVIELDPEALTVGRDRNRWAIDLWAECRRTNTWPGYGPDVQRVNVPRWALIEHEHALEQQPGTDLPW